MTATEIVSSESPSSAANSLAKSDDRAQFGPLIMCVGLIFIGVLLRVLRYYANRPLWLDEAALANNIRDLSFAGLTKPLAWGHGAPIGFLWHRARSDLTLMPFVSGQYSMTKASDRPPDLLALRGTKRVWIIFSFVSDHRGTVSEVELVLCVLDSMGQRLDQIAAEGASAYLYDLSDNHRSP
jgi:hypothetical protein